MYVCIYIYMHHGGVNERADPNSFRVHAANMENKKFMNPAQTKN